MDKRTKADPAMNDAQAKQDFYARLGNVYFDSEGDLHDLKNMAGIAQSLFDDIKTITDENSGLMTIKMLEQEFERLQFAIYRTSRMAGALLDAFDEAANDKGCDKPLETAA